MKNWYALNTGGSKPYEAIGPFNRHSLAEAAGLSNFGKVTSVVFIDSRLARSKYRVYRQGEYDSAS